MKQIYSLTLIVAILISSCTTVYYTNSGYKDANYLSSDELGEINNSRIEALNSSKENYNDTTDQAIESNYYDNDYDFSYSARIRRFHRPLWNTGYYGGLYTDYYWYSHNPHHYGMSIYYGSDPYLSYYSPYYSIGYSYYSPYYSIGYSYYSPYYNHPYHYTNHKIYTNNRYDPNSYHYGPRGSLSSRNNKIKNVGNTKNNYNLNRKISRDITRNQTINSRKNVTSETQINKENISKYNRGESINKHRSISKKRTSNNDRSYRSSGRSYKANPRNNASKRVNNSSTKTKSRRITPRR